LLAACFQVTQPLLNRQSWPRAWTTTPGCATGAEQLLVLCRSVQYLEFFRGSALRWPLGRTPHTLESSLPGIFAVGDVRAGSVKRVASAVGEGAAVIALVHRALHE
jgi:thioredoxin reductase (NADPH)